MSALLAFLIRLLALAAGLVIAATVAAAAFAVAALVLLHAGWARLAGGAPRVGGQRFRWPGFLRRRPSPKVYVPSGVPPRRGPADISDVEPR